MHLGNGAITPECALLTYSAAAAGLGLAVFAQRRRPLQPGRWAMAGGLGAAVFAAQMVNVPLLPEASGHLVGGVLLAWVLGPSLGAITMAVVLAVQAMMLGDGGLAALGANIVNMALVPSGLTSVARRLAPQTASPGIQGLAAGGCGALAVVGGALFAVGEVAIGRGAGVGEFAIKMLTVHAWIGLAEGLATLALVAVMVWAEQRAGRRYSRYMPAGALGVAALLILAALPFASTLPDGYEASAESSGWQALLAEDGAVLNLAAWELQSRAVTALESLLGDGTWMAMLAAVVAGGLAFASAAVVRGRSFAAAVAPTEAKCAE